ncbi:MAG: TonB-dependent receptor [Saprospiraceae bacterium]|nr:TonB-dependent receptor [Saprospiraceae bacterium]
MKNILILFCFLIPALSSGQNSEISGSVIDHNNLPVIYANVVLYSLIDSSIVKVEYSNETGNYSIKGISSGSYFIGTSYVGYPDAVSPGFDISDSDLITLDPIRFEPSSNELEEVTVTAKKPLLEMKPDKMILNVEGSINNSGSDAYTLLRQSPGVMIDNNDNIFMLGKSGLQIFIDGRPTQLNGSDLADFLKTIPSSEIESIEIITNPSSKYEAEGNAGIINIKLLRDKNLGANGSLNTTYSIGQKSRYNTTLRGTYKSKAWNTYGTVTGYKGADINPFNLYREQQGLSFDQASIGNDSWNGFNSRAGVDYILNEKSTFGFLANLSKSQGHHVQNTESDIFKTGSSLIDSTLVAMSDNESDRSNWNINGNYKYSDKQNRSLNIDVDYGKYSRTREAFQPNTYFGAGGMILSTKDFFTYTPTDIEIATAKLDFEQDFLNGRLQFGAKVANVITDNVFDFYNVYDENRELDTERSNDFRYSELVYASYANYSMKINDLSLQAGLRIEHTNSEGHLTALIPSENELVERSYTDLFPSFGLTYQLNEKNRFQLNYSRRLNRPSYQDMNPFRSRLDELTFEQGNPFLNPEYSSTLQVSHSWNYKLTTSFSYSHTRDLITRVTDTTELKSAFITWLNLADQYTYSISVSAPLPITEWWNSYTSITGVRTLNKADFGEGKFIDLSANTFSAYSQHSFSIPGGYMAELSGWYNSPSLWGGTFMMNEMWSVDFGVQKKFLDDRLTVKASVSDVFKSTGWSGTSDFGALYLNVDGQNDSRRFKLNLAYRFGNQQVKARKRNTGLEEESKRIKQ